MLIWKVVEISKHYYKHVDFKYAPFFRLFSKIKRPSNSQSKQWWSSHWINSQWAIISVAVHNKQKRWCITCAEIHRSLVGGVTLPLQSTSNYEYKQLQKKKDIPNHRPTLIDSGNRPKWQHMKLNRFDKQNWCAQRICFCFAIDSLPQIQSILTQCFYYFCGFFLRLCPKLPMDRVFIWINESNPILLSLRENNVKEMASKIEKPQTIWNM